MFQFVNGAFERLAGYAKQELVGKSFQTFLKTEKNHQTDLLETVRAHVKNGQVRMLVCAAAAAFCYKKARVDIGSGFAVVCDVRVSVFMFQPWEGTFSIQRRNGEEVPGLSQTVPVLGQKG